MTHKGNKYKHYIPSESIAWWQSLTIEEKVKMKKGFESFRESLEGKKYPDMYNTSNYRISQLHGKHISRIWVFRDRYN